MGRTNQARQTVATGGVAANIACHLAASGADVRFLGVQPPDEAPAMARRLGDRGVAADILPLAGEVPGYSAVMGPDGELLIGAAALALYDAVTPAMITPRLDAATPLVIDANFPEDVLLAMARAGAANRPLFAAGTAIGKVERLRPCLPFLRALVLNRAEAARLLAPEDVPVNAPEVDALARDLAARLPDDGLVLVSDGAAAAALADRTGVAIRVPPQRQVVNANGAGDAMAAALFWGLVTAPDMPRATRLRHALAAGAAHAAAPPWRPNGAFVMTDSHADFIFSEEVAAARGAGRPLVALESTLISHGLPFPDNIEVARAAEAAVRQGGAVPATIAVMESRPCAGLDAAGMQRLATAGDVKKLSRRDLPAALSGAASAPVLGATTVSATMILARKAGISVFATGGIGGVHRGGEASMDVSADLFELAHTPVAVVCSGPKVILDLPRTREVLETMGVTLVGYRTDDMPAFWARHSGLPVDLTADSPAEIAAVIRSRAGLGIGGAVLVCNPVDRDLAIGIDEIEGWIAACIGDAPAGAAATPWLLAEIARRSGGRSLAANKRLIIDNAGLAGAIAASL